MKSKWESEKEELERLINVEKVSSLLELISLELSISTNNCLSSSNLSKYL